MVSPLLAEPALKANPARRRPRICLVVDSPLRDLEGITLVAWHLARQGADPVLVPMYEQGFEVLGLCPDAVLVNYARTTNRFLLEAYREAGIPVSVLDTEGGVVDSLDDYASSIKRNGTVPFVDQMMIWGPLQEEAFKRYSGLEANQLVLTGCPRMDFCAEPWRAALPLPDKVTPPIVLINTNFSLVNPRFSRSVEHELATTVTAGFSGWDEGYVQDLAAATRSGFESMIATACMTAERMPHIHFVVRPHPFESMAPYESALAHLSNVQVRLEGSVATWLQVSAAVVHLNCGSAVEAALMGIPALSLEWLNSEVLIRNAAVPRELSVHVHSAADLEHKLDILTRNGSLPDGDATRQRTLNILEQWFYKNDGKAAERVASGLLDLVDRAERTPSSAKCRRLALIGGKRHQPLVGLADGLGRVVLGRWHAWMRTNILTGGVNRSARRAKSFTVRQIEQILQRINTVARLDGPTIVPARVRRSEGEVPGLSSSAVRLLPVSQI